jgi:hypothetical protein
MTRASTHVTHHHLAKPFLLAFSVFIVVLCLVDASLLSADDVVDDFNNWFLSEAHRHRVVRVRAKRLNEATGDNGIGLVVTAPGDDDGKGLAPGAVYLDVNTSLAMSARSWLIDGGRSVFVATLEDVRNPTLPQRKRLLLRQALQLATLRWILSTHTDMSTDVQELMMASAEDHEDWRKRNATAGRVLEALTTDERDIVLAMYLMFEYVVNGVKD